jgi:hypothetical protein
VSNNDSFIEEVTEEVRKDRLYGYLRRYGWIPLLAVFLIVGGAAWNEYSKAQARAAAEARGDALLAALQANEAEARAAALAALPFEGPAGVVNALLTAAGQEEAGQREAAIATLEALAVDGTVSPLYRDLAAIKALILSEGLSDPATRRAGLEALASPGAPFRLIALEQLALSDLAMGETEAALAGLFAIIEDAGATAGLRDRASALIVALGGDPDAPRGI